MLKACCLADLAIGDKLCPSRPCKDDQVGQQGAMSLSDMERRSSLQTLKAKAQQLRARYLPRSANLHHDLLDWRADKGLCCPTGTEPRCTFQPLDLLSLGRILADQLQQVEAITCGMQRRNYTCFSCS